MVTRDDDGDIGVPLRVHLGQHPGLAVPHGEDLGVLGEELGVGVQRIPPHLGCGIDEADIARGQGAAESDHMRI